MCFCFLLLLGFVLSAAAELRPRHPWRITPTDWSAGSSPEQVRNLSLGKTATWHPRGQQGHWLSFRFRAADSLVLLTFSAHPRVRVNLMATKEGRTDTTDWGWSGPYLNQVLIHANPKSRYRIAFRPEGKTEPKIWNLGLYGPRREGRNDYWLALGASIQNQSMRQSCFQPEAVRWFGNADPILFNLSVPGWSSSDLLDALPSFFRAHPFSTYVLLHIGGNNVSSSRPFPGGRDILANDLDSIVTLVSKAGKIPVVARLSYRKYRSEPVVPPDRNGSGPYVQALYDPRIASGSSSFYDWRKGKGLVDFYEFIRTHEEYLSTDGIHLNALGEKEWCRYWARQAGQVVYGGKKALDLTAVSEISKEGLKFVITSAPSYPVLIRNSEGKVVRRLVPLSRDSILTWDFRDAKGNNVAPGLYHWKGLREAKHKSGTLLVTPGVR